MNLNKINYKEFRFGDIIDKIYKSKAYTKEDVEETDYYGNYIPFISRTERNNAVDMVVLNESLDGVEDGNALTIGDTTATINYQPIPFVCGDHMVVIRASWLNQYTGLYVVSLLNRERYRYSYGRAFVMDNIKETILMLPVNDDGNPDWQFMENYIKSLHHKPITTKNTKVQVPELNIQKWKEFRVGDLFPKKRCNHFSATPESEGKIPFISSTSNNNGVAAMVDEESIEGNCITVSTNGDCFDCFYQPDPIVISNDVEVLYGEHINPYTAMFISTVLMQEKIKWSYGRKPKNDKVYDTIIKLPTDIDGNPDWQFMEEYIKTLPYGDRI